MRRIPPPDFPARRPRLDRARRGSDPADLKIALVGVHDSETDCYTSYLEPELQKLWPILERADMLDTKVGRSKKDDPADVARTGFDAMMRGDGDVVSGWMNKMRAAIANITPASVLAEMHRGMAQPEKAQS